MEPSNNDEKTKALLIEVIVELAKTKREVLYEIMLKAMEKVGLANAIAEGRKQVLVSEEEIFSILGSNVSMPS